MPIQAPILGSATTTVLGQETFQCVDTNAKVLERVNFHYFHLNLIVTPSNDSILNVIIKFYKQIRLDEEKKMEHLGDAEKKDHSDKHTHKNEIVHHSTHLPHNAHLVGENTKPEETPSSNIPPHHKAGSHK